MKQAKQDAEMDFLERYLVRFKGNVDDIVRATNIPKEVFLGKLKEYGLDVENYK